MGIGRNASERGPDRNPIASFFKHFAERASRVAVSNRAAHASTLETVLVHLLADVQRQWATKILKSQGKLAPAMSAGDTRVVINGWSIGVDSNGPALRLFQIV